MCLIRAFIYVPKMFMLTVETTLGGTGNRPLTASLLSRFHWF
jgi:hypothetical protein